MPLNRDLIRRIVESVNDAPDPEYDTSIPSVPGPCIVELMYRFNASPTGNTVSITEEELVRMPQYVTVTGDKRFEGRTNVHLLPGLHGVGMVDGRKVTVVTLNREPHVVPTDQCEVWTSRSGHSSSGLQYQYSDRGGFRIVVVNRAAGTLHVLRSIADVEEGDAAETALYRNYTTRVNAAIDALEGN